VKRLFCSIIPQIALLLVALLFNGVAKADDHVLPISELRGAVLQASADRSADRSAIDQFFSEPRVKNTLKNAGFDAEKIQRQAMLLSDQEQSRLAARVRAANQQISAGELKDQQITLIILAVTLFAFTAVLVLAFK